MGTSNTLKKLERVSSFAFKSCTSLFVVLSSVRLTSVLDFLTNLIARSSFSKKTLSYIPVKKLFFGLILFASILSLIPAYAASNERKSLDTLNDVSRDMGMPIVTQRMNSSNAAIGLYASNGITTLSRFISEAIKYVAVLAMVAITWGGITYVTAYGDDKKVGKAKNIILYALFGVVLSVAAYAIIDIINNLSLK